MKDTAKSSPHRPDLVHNPDYEDAKYGGDADAALRIVRSTLHKTFLARMKIELGMLPSHIGAPILVAPFKEDSPNRLARTMAVYLGDELGLEVDDQILEHSKGSLKNMSKLERIFHSPDFEGPVQEGRWYIGVDDVLSSGTTMASLRSYLTQNGAHFVCGYTLGSPDGKNQILNASASEIAAVEKNLGQTLSNWIENVKEISLKGITGAEARLLGAPNARHAVGQFAATHS